MYVCNAMQIFSNTICWFAIGRMISPYHWAQLMGSDKIHTALRTYVQCLSFSQLYSLPLLTWRRPLARRYGADVVSLHVVSSHSWIISYNIKWYKTSVVFTTVFHRALLSCRWQRSWIVSSVWILAPRLWLRCWLWDVQSSLISIPA